MAAGGWDEGTGVKPEAFDTANPISNAPNK